MLPAEDSEEAAPKALAAPTWAVRTSARRSGRDHRCRRSRMPELRPGASSRSSLSTSIRRAVGTGEHGRGGLGLAPNHSSRPTLTWRAADAGDRGCRRLGLGLDRGLGLRAAARDRWRPSPRSAPAIADAGASAWHFEPEPATDVDQARGRRRSRMLRPRLGASSRSLRPRSISRTAGVSTSDLVRPGLDAHRLPVA